MSSLPLHIPTHTEHDIKKAFVHAIAEQGLYDNGFIHDYYESLSVRDRLLALLQSDLGFEGHRSGYASHDLHAFAAKFPPQLARVFIQGLSLPGDTVLDPMVGSGTTAVEAMLCQRKAIGVDIDPLALRLTRVKTTRFDPPVLRAVVESVVNRARQRCGNSRSLENQFRERFTDAELEFFDYWFLKPTQLELMGLLTSMEEVPDEIQRSFLDLIFSSVIVTKSGGVSRARDLAHSRPHLDTSKAPKNAIDQFVVRATKGLASVAAMRQCRFKPRVLPGDARALSLADETVDLIVTSPPYANAIDYMRAHKFSLVWLGNPLSNLTALRAQYIGSEKTNGFVRMKLPKQVRDVLERLGELDAKKSLILEKYFVEMTSVIEEMYRVLRVGGCSVVVVGTSTMRGMDVETHLCLSRIAQHVGFDVVGIAKRQLDRNRRMMPARFGRQNTNGIEQRMYDEYVIGLLKPNS